jgi:hypothetical protein
VPNNFLRGKYLPLRKLLGLIGRWIRGWFYVKIVKDYRPSGELDVFKKNRTSGVQVFRRKDGFGIP